MTAARVNNAEFTAPEVVVNTIYQRSLGVGLLFGVVSLITAILPGTREQFFHSYLLGFMLWLGVALGSMAFLMIQHLTGGLWGMVIRRQLEAAMKTLPERYQAVIGLYYLGGKTMREIGDRLGINESRVSQIHRAALDKMSVSLQAAGIYSSECLI